MQIEPEKLDAAIENLDWAARLFIEHKAYRAATTLAAAAEGLLGKSLRQDARAHTQLKVRLAKVTGLPADMIGAQLNDPRNFLKHGSPSRLELEWPLNAAAEIFRAAINLRELGHPIPDSVRPVLTWLNLPDD
jgi:hypothetical protein